MHAPLCLIVCVLQGWHLPARVRSWQHLAYIIKLCG